MEFRDYAQRVVISCDLEEKLALPPRGLTDHEPGEALFVERPGRARGLEIQPGRSARVPSAKGMADLAQRRRILHAFANHELQAVELFAWALLAFPAAEPEFRRGLVRQVAEEIAHVQLYQRRLEELETKLGDYPVSGYFWSKIRGVRTPRQFVAALCLTFENANLDLSLEFAEAARQVGDVRTAHLLERVHADEIRHVSFGREWLGRWRGEGESLEAAYLASVAWPLRPALARGKTFQREARREAGLDGEFLRLFEEADPRSRVPERR